MGQAPVVYGQSNRPPRGDYSRASEDYTCPQDYASYTEADHDTWREAEVAPYVAHAIDCFGFDRVMFGGDWPVSELATTYRRWVDLVDSVVAGASEGERRRLYRDNAIAFYRL